MPPELEPEKDAAGCSDPENHGRQSCRSTPLSASDRERDREAVATRVEHMQISSSSSEAASAITTNSIGDQMSTPSLNRRQSAEEVFAEAINFARTSPSSIRNSILPTIGVRSLYPTIDSIEAADVTTTFRHGKEEQKTEEGEVSGGTGGDHDDDDDDDEDVKQPATPRGKSREEEKEEILRTEPYDNCIDSTETTATYEYASASAAAVSVATGEATVLDDEGRRIPETDAFYDDGENDDDLVAMKRRAYEGGARGGDWSTRVSSCDSSCRWPGNGSVEDAVATVTAVSGEAVVEAIVTDDFVHPSDPSLSSAVRAHFVGEDFSRTTSQEHQSDGLTQQLFEGDHSITAMNAYASVEGGTHDEENAATEATVIDSAPLDRNSDWKYTEEAQVLEEDSTLASDIREVDKEYMNEGSDTQAQHQRQLSTATDYAFVEEEAEILAIQEDVHPLELERTDAEAELVGTDYTVGVATATAHIIRESPTALAAAGGAQSETPAVSEVVAMVSESDMGDPWGRVPEAHQEPQLHATPIVNRDISAATSAGRTSAQRPSFSPYPPNSNPFEDDPGESPALSRDAIAQLDAQEISQSTWMHASSTTNDGDPSLPPPVALPASATIVEPTAAAAAATPHKTVDFDEPGVSVGGTTTSSESPYGVPDWLRDRNNNNHNSNASVTGTPSLSHTHGRPPPPCRFGSASRPQESGTNESHYASSGGGTAASDRSMSSIQALTTNLVRGTSCAMEVLFGDSKPPFLNRRAPVSADQAAHFILPREMLPWSVIYSPQTGMWVATLQTNQKAIESNNVVEASKSLRAFSLPTEKQALCLARAWTPPRMLPFEKNTKCHLCNDKFAVFRRACHCRNCGVCICKDCTVQWPNKMIPDTYNRKNEVSVNICKTCDWLCNQFRLALLEGDFDKAVALHSTGNINLSSPFANVKGELFYPVHCAVIGGNLRLLKWLVDENCCPIRSVRVSGKTNNCAGKYTPIVTSKGRSLLGIAMENGHVPIIRYLVVVKGISISSENDITPAMLLNNLDAVLRLLPGEEDNAVAQSQATGSDVDAYSESLLYEQASAPMEEYYAENSAGRTLSEEARAFGAVNQSSSKDDENDSSHEDECILCCDAKIDCVSNPCGHQIMCLRCSEHVTRCPVCSTECTFIKVYRT